MRTIRNIDGQLVSINPAFITSAILGTPDEGTQYITYSPTKIELSTGTTIEIDQNDEDNHDFLMSLFGFNWEKEYTQQSHLVA